MTAGDKRPIYIRGATLFPYRRVWVTHTTLRLNPKKNPKEIDLTPVMEGKTEGKTKYGIYHIEKASLTICTTIGNGPRPKDFRPGKGRHVVKYTRKQAKE